jgi:hypothetical protein
MEHRAQAVQPQVAQMDRARAGRERERRDAGDARQPAHPRRLHRRQLVHQRLDGDVEALENDARGEREQETARCARAD